MGLWTGPWVPHGWRTGKLSQMEPGRRVPLSPGQMLFAGLMLVWRGQNANAERGAGPRSPSQASPVPRCQGWGPRRSQQRPLPAGRSPQTSDKSRGQCRPPGSRGREGGQRRLQGLGQAGWASVSTTPSLCPLSVRGVWTCRLVNQPRPRWGPEGRPVCPGQRLLPASVELPAALLYYLGLENKGGLSPYRKLPAAFVGRHLNRGPHPGALLLGGSAHFPCGGKGGGPVGVCVRPESR